MKMVNMLKMLGIALLLSGNLLASEAQDIEKIRNSLKILLPSVEPDSVAATPLPGIYEVLFGPRLLYLSADGRYLLQGEITDLETRENLTEPRVASAKLKAVEEIGEENMIIFGKPEAKYTLSIFTDIDCGYCRKLHSEIDQYIENDIRVRYLFYPRSGVSGESYKKAEAVWCAQDRQQAMTDAKQGKTPEYQSCENPVKDHYVLGQVLGVEGTPALVLDDGTMVPGYIPAARLKLALDARGAKK